MLHTVLHNTLHFDRYSQLGTTTPRDYGSLFAQVARGSLVSPQASREMLTIFRAQHYNNHADGRFPALLPGLRGDRRPRN